MKQRKTSEKNTNLLCEITKTALTLEGNDVFMNDLFTYKKKVKEEIGF